VLEDELLSDPGADGIIGEVRVAEGEPSSERFS